MDVLLVGDFNAHSPVWGHPFEDKRGEDLLDFCATTGLEICNDPNSEPTHSNNVWTRSGHGDSWIDLVMFKSQSDANISDWMIEEQPTCSDHRRMSCQLNFERAQNQKSKRYKIQFQNWLQLKAELAKKLEQLEITHQDNTPLSDQIVNITREVTEIYEKMKREPSDRVKKVPWWNTDLTILRKHVMASRRRW